MNRDGTPTQTVPQALLTLVSVAVMCGSAISWIGMSSRPQSLMAVVVASGPIAHNVPLVSQRLKYQIHRIPRDAHPVQRLADAEGRFVSDKALKRCGSKPCAKLILFREDLLDRPELTDGGEVFKAALNSPWTIADFAVGDEVWAIAIRSPQSSASRAMKVVALGSVQNGLVYVSPTQALDPAALEELRTSPVRVVGLRR